MRSKTFPQKWPFVFLGLTITVLCCFSIPKSMATDGPSDNVSRGPISDHALNDHALNENVPSVRAPNPNTDNLNANKRNSQATKAEIGYHDYHSCRDLVTNPSEREFLAGVGMKSPSVDYLMGYISIVAKESSGQLSPEMQLALREKIPHQAQWLLNAAFVNFLVAKKQPKVQKNPDSSSSSIIDKDLETRTHLLMRLLAFDTLALSLKFRFDQQHRMLLEKIVKRSLKPSDLIGLDYEQSAQLQYIILTFALMDTMTKIDRATLELTGNLRQRSAHDLPSKIWELSSKDSSLQSLYRQYQILLTIIDQIQQLKIDIDRTNRPMSFTMATSGGFMTAKRLLPELGLFSSLKDFLQFFYLAQEAPPGAHAH